MKVETVKVKPWGDEQGDHVVINADDFDPEIHTLLDETGEEPAAKPARKAKAKAEE